MRGQRRREAAAATAVLVILAHLLLAQLTLALAVGFTATTRVSRWRLWWLAVPAVIGVAWMLAIGPGNALAGFAAGPARIFAYLDGGPLLARLDHLPGALAGAGDWLPGQLPLALLFGAAEAAMAGWLGWPGFGGRAVPAPRPGALAALRRNVAARLIGSGAVLTRQGCALGVVAATGGVAELRWADIADGLLIAGAAERQVMVASLQVVHAALRRRKPLVVIDGSDGVAIGAVLARACTATGVPLRLVRLEDADLDQVVADLGQVLRERSAALLAAGSPEGTALAEAAVTALGADLRRIGVDGDGVIWIPGGEAIPAAALGALIRHGGEAGLPALIGATSPSVAAELAGLVGAVLARRLADPALAASLAGWAGTVAPSALGQPCPVLPERALLSLGPADFMLAVAGRGRCLVRSGRLVLARLPRVPLTAGEAEAGEVA